MSALRAYGPSESDPERRLIQGSGDETWRISGATTLSLRDWDGECAVYNPLSGNTHVLDIVSATVLRLIVAGDKSVTALRARISDFLEVPDDQRMAEHVRRVLAVLDELGLIEPIPGC